ncbi:tRNA pseudouridine(55) synthase TruB [Flavobacteriaceae bacterium]|jgi:tRNA pseudouridine55 synthase|nr:tRNA pseudouridine(55) synthase TruB [Flavobacteriaceae bacterium]MDB2388808.1 tRNA pseudouridine(55) synthase TruB [Flavobacteriaceae bacterium]
MSDNPFVKGQVILIDKPLNWTSFQVVNKVRWLIRKHYGLKKLKVGHAGTLDPLATGLLILCTGAMTKSIEEFQGQEKKYTGRLKLGATTPSYDLETEINATFKYEHITEEMLHGALPQFTGTILQKPPIFSAIKKDGKRLYSLAREGKTTELPDREITIKEFTLSAVELPDVEFNVRCSKGTYIRSLAHDFGAALDSGAHLTALRRTAIGSYDVAQAISIEQFEDQLAQI